MIRDAFKSLLRTPAFAVGAILTFALGIGVNVAVFSAVDRVLFRPLPYDHPERLVVMTLYREGSADEPDLLITAPYVLRARQAPEIEEVTTTNLDPFRFRFTQDADGARYFAFVSMASTALKTLGLRPVIGSDFTEDDVRQKRLLVLLTYDTWQRQFDGRLDAIGRRIWSRSADTVYEIAGVLPRDFIPPQRRVTEPWSGIVMSWSSFDATAPSKSFYTTFLRLKPGVSIAQAQARMDSILAELGPDPARTGIPTRALRLSPIRDLLVGRYATYVALTFTAATLVLLVGCANLASLLLVRARSREHRAAIQLALGASAGRLMKMALVEALLLALIGGAVAVGIIGLANQAMANWLPPLFASYLAPVLEIRVLLFSLAVTIASALAAGVTPGWRASRTDFLSVLQRGSRAGSGRLRGSGALMAIEIALSTMLVLGAFLMVRTLTNLKGEDVGFEPERLFAVGAYLPPGDKVLQLQQYTDMLAILRRMPGVQAAAGADTLPIMGDINRPMFPFAPPENQRCPVSEGLIETLGMRVIAGRTFTAQDVQSKAPIGMLSVAGLKSVWPGVSPHDAVGRFLTFSDEPPREVVGIVSDVRYQYNSTIFPSLYVPIGSERFGGMLFAARVQPGHTLSTADVAREFKARGYAPRTVGVVPIADNFATGVVDQTFRARLFGGFGVAALLLAMIGIYAVQSFAVTQRRAEFGIRLSLGATPGDVRRLLIRDTLRPTVMGVSVGLVAAYWGAQFLQSFLYGVGAHDPWTFAGVALLLVATAMAAVWFPARRASRTDPAVVLRAE